MAIYRGTGGANEATDLATNQAVIAKQFAEDAANFATQANLTLDAFQDIYLGAFATAPTLDNDGNALQVGALYFNITSNQLFIRSSTDWQLHALGNDSVFTAAIQNNAVTSQKIADGAIITTRLADNSVTTAKVVDGNITSAKLATNIAVAGTLSSVGYSGTTGTYSGLMSLGNNLTFTGTGRHITGDFSTATIADRVSFQSSTTNGATTIQAIPNGTLQPPVVHELVY